MTVTTGDEHEFLGIKIKFQPDGLAQLDMSSYLRNAIDASGMDIRRHAKTAAKKDLRQVNEDSPLLNSDDATRFVSCVYMLMHVALRARSDLCPAVSFLTSRVSTPTKQDRDKLKRLLEFILSTINDKSYLGADDLSKFAMYVDVAFAVHHDRKSHTGGVITFSTGGLMVSSTKHRLVGRSSTEGELVGASDYLPNGIWLKRYLEGQGIPVNEVIFHQDNEAAINIETNGRASASTRLRRHLDIQCFFVKDHIKANGISLRYCNTAIMLADFLTKPLQGRLFHMFRAVLLGHRHISCLIELLPASDMRVEKKVKSGSHARKERPTGGARVMIEKEKWEETRIKVHPAITLPLTHQYQTMMNKQ
eukprot:CAMPEP_0202474244 /NCGR_PEP_ID=MMETSP1360-20130828/92277_1 /ASSEMBLY_ACC=CAM_ASM_000848 /TAXON_ID=515479 /ORGANISM="Licmophora paradoxa, Strain CCMP2313" /LENGTH=362 /DNA_ID=CAMNT_0049101351 /DNA_START=30 /DNA_END=1118 /DNA_ORIENTATION=-